MESYCRLRCLAWHCLWGSSVEMRATLFLFMAVNVLQCIYPFCFHEDLFLESTLPCTFLFMAAAVQEQASPGYKPGMMFLSHLILPGDAKLCSQTWSPMLVVGIWTTILWGLSCDDNFLGWVFSFLHLLSAGGSDVWFFVQVLVGVRRARSGFFLLHSHSEREHPWKPQLRRMWDFLRPPTSRGLWALRLCLLKLWKLKLRFALVLQTLVFTCLSGFLPLLSFWLKYSLFSCYLIYAFKKKFNCMYIYTPILSSILVFFFCPF